MAVENVIIEFTADTTGLQPAEDRLSNLGKIDQQQAGVFKQTTQELNKRTAVMNQVASTTTGAVKATQTMANAVKSETAVTKLSAAEFKKMGVTLEQLIADEKQKVKADKDATQSTSDNTKATKQNETATVALRQQLKNLTQSIATLKLANKDNTEEYKKMVVEAGNIKDAIGDAAQEIKDAGSDTKTFDNLLGSAQAVAGGFAVAQGAAALFGDENEALQETLLRVTAVMSILQGLQAIQNALQKEGAVTLLAKNIQQRVGNAQLAIAIGLESTSIVVRGAATVAQRILNAAMAANPIGLLVVGITALIAAIGLYSRNAKKAAADQAALNGALQSAGEQLDANIEGLNNANKVFVSDLEKGGARQSKIQQATLMNEKMVYEARATELQNLKQKIAATENSTNKETLKSREAAQKRVLELDLQQSAALADLQVSSNEVLRQLGKEALDDQVSLAQVSLSNSLKNSKQEFAARRQLAKAQADADIFDAGTNGAKIKAIKAKLNDELRQIDQDAAKVRHEDAIAAIDLQLIDAQNASKAINDRTSQEEIDLQKKRILAVADFESKQEGLSNNQRLAIRAKGLQDAAQLQKDFNKKSVEESLQDYISVNNKQLQNLNISEEYKLQLITDNIIAAAQIEISANEGKVAKIKEIEATRDAAVKAARLASIEDTVNKEIAAADRSSATYRASLQRTADDSKKSLDLRISAIDQLTNYELSAIDKKQQALDDELAGNLISVADYNAKYDALVNEQVEIIGEAERKKKGLISDTTKSIIAGSLEAAAVLVSTLSDIYSAQADAQQQAIDEQRQQVDDLLQTGAITAKEAAKRQKQLDLQEKRQRQQAAERDKKIAVFNALLAIPAAYLRGLTTPGIGSPLLGAIYAALAAVSAAVVIAKPVPKFGKGKKDSYEGPAEVGEAGAELIEHNGRMYVADKSQIVWLDKKDKVYNPAETRAMLSKPSLLSNRAVMQRSAEPAAMLQIDYKRIGKEVGANISQPGFSFDENGFKTWVKNGRSFTNYLNK